MRQSPVEEACGGQTVRDWGVIRKGNIRKTIADTHRSIFFQLRHQDLGYPLPKGRVVKAETEEQNQTFDI